MKKLQNKAFTLVELLVVITILAIISVVAYQNFGWAVDKAVSGRKIGDVSTIETSLQQFKVDNNYYPAVDLYNATSNMWWYNNAVEATPSNTLNVTMNGAEITSVDWANGGWRVMNIDNTQQIWAKGTLSQETLWKKYLTKDLFDPEVGDLKENTNNKKLIELGLGRYVYAIYKKPQGANWWTDNKTGTYYNIAYTIKKEASDTYVTKIVWDYDSGSCFDNSANCPKTLVWSQNSILVNEQEQGKTASWTALAAFGSTSTNQWIPYPVSEFE